jgi:hypothetical protein
MRDSEDAVVIIKYDDVNFIAMGKKIELVYLNSIIIIAKTAITGENESMIIIELKAS